MLIQSANHRTKYAFLVEIEAKMKVDIRTIIAIELYLFEPLVLNHYLKVELV